jgi:hypothetical protein
MPAIQPALRIYDDTFDDKSYTDVNRLANAMLTQADILSPIVTNLFGRMSDRFPLMLLTEGRNKIKPVKSVDGAFKIPIMGKPKKSSTTTKSFYVDGDTPGKGKTEFKLAFADRWFERDYTIESPGPDFVQAKIVDNPEQDGDSWVYTLRITGSSFGEYCPYKFTKPGVKWSRMYAVVGISGSRGNASRNQAPGMMQNQVSFLRKSYEYKGNVQKKVMVMEIPTGSGSTKYWCEWEAYLRGLEWKEECENNLWYSRYNRDADGLIHDKDINSGEIAPQASGVLEQIPNSSTYSFLTEEKLKRTMRDVFFNSAAGTKKNIEIFVGTGSREAVDTALKGAIKGLTLVDSKFVGGEGSSLVYGSYFSTYRHVDGHTATIRYMPILDNGTRAEKAELHPISGLPMTSYDIYFLDMSDIDGEANIMYLAEEGREDMEVFVPGLTIPDGFTANGAMRASDIDGSSIHFAKSLGSHIKNPINAFKMTCDLS